MTDARRVLILQHLTGDGPAYLATSLARHGIAADVRNTQAGDPYPADMAGHSALAVLGGEMSANDPLPSLRQAEALILDAMARQRPVLGHCLGGQLMARALGARIAASPAPEIGWQPLQVLPGPAAARWFGPAGALHVFHWHFEAFDLPPGAQRLASSAACPNQAFAIGPHLAMQFHVEVDAEKIGRWSQAAAAPEAAAMRHGIGQHLARQQALADRLYAHWWAAAAG